MALIAGSLGMIITMVLHPRGRIAPAEVDALVRKLLEVHSLALASIPLLFLGAWGIARRFAAADRLSWTGLGIYGYATAAVLSGTVMDGLVEPRLLQQIIGSTAQTRELWQAITKYNALVVGGFVRVYVVAAGLAILLWSVSMVKNGKRGFGIALYGGVLGIATVAGVLAGFLSPESHAFVMVIVGQAVWFLSVGVTMWGEREAVGHAT
ncbi:MAG TPA: hypothetical protein VE077_10550 [Candidatus Methylomirabilis sp.]|nr:hypothetical protein [Candidatus Methylomirabilis sp.]